MLSRNVPLLLTAVILVATVALQVYAQRCCATLTPGPIAVPGVVPDSLDYVMGAVSLFHGAYVVDWDGTARVPQYPPGMPLLLLPAIAVGGIQAAIWMIYVSVALAGVFAASIASRVAGAWAAPVAVVLVLVVPAAMRLGHLIMSELPSAALVLAQVHLLVVRRRATIATLGAGILGGCLVWLRPAAAVLLIAGLAAISARPATWRGSMIYVVGALMPIAALGLVQAIMFGSPFTTGYQAVALNPSGRHDLGAFFSLAWVLGPPAVYESAGMGGTGVTWHLLNIQLYPLQLLGLDEFVAWPGVGLVGMWAAWSLARQHAACGVLGRFALGSVVATLVTYIPYWYQSGRFLILPATLLGLATAVRLTPGGLVVLRRWWMPRSRGSSGAD